MTLGDTALQFSLPSAEYLMLIEFSFLLISFLLIQ